MSQTVTNTSESGKIIPDEGALGNEFELTAKDKVQLDIDDAPFLLDPDEEESPPPAVASANSLLKKEDRKSVV